MPALFVHIVRVCVCVLFNHVLICLCLFVWLVGFFVFSKLNSSYYVYVYIYIYAYRMLFDAFIYLLILRIIYPSILYMYLSIYESIEFFICCLFVCCW